MNGAGVAQATDRTDCKNCPIEIRFEGLGGNITNMTGSRTYPLHPIMKAIPTADAEFSTTVVLPRNQSARGK